MVYAQSVGRRFVFRVVPTACYARVICALYVAGQRVADNDDLFPALGYLLEYTVEILVIRLLRIIRAPGMALQHLTTKEPTKDMLEVAIAAFNLAMDPNYKVENAAGAAQSAE